MNMLLANRSQSRRLYRHCRFIFFQRVLSKALRKGKGLKVQHRRTNRTDFFSVFIVLTYLGTPAVPTLHQAFGRKMCRGAFTKRIATALFKHLVFVEIETYSQGVA